MYFTNDADSLKIVSYNYLSCKAFIDSTSFTNLQIFVCTVKVMLCVISFLMHLSLQMIYSGALSSHVIMVKKPLPAGKYDCKKH